MNFKIPILTNVYLGFAPEEQESNTYSTLRKAVSNPFLSYTHLNLAAITCVLKRVTPKQFSYCILIYSPHKKKQEKVLYVTYHTHSPTPFQENSCS